LIPLRADATFDELSPLLALGELSREPWSRLVGIWLAVAIVGAVFVALLVRGYRRKRARLKARRRATPPPMPPISVSVARRPHPSGVEARGSVDGGALASVASSTAPSKVGCPACRREFPPGVRFCPYDARRLVPAAELPERSRVAGSVCPRCRRAYEPGIKYCPHDAEELMAAPLWEATRGRKQDAAPTGVLAKICPRCTGRYDLATTFCGKDGAELMTIN
jgi:hypothetical protein